MYLDVYNIQKPDKFNRNDRFFSIFNNKTLDDLDAFHVSKYPILTIRSLLSDCYYYKYNLKHRQILLNENYKLPGLQNIINHNPYVIYQFYSDNYNIDIFCIDEYIRATISYTLYNNTPVIINNAKYVDFRYNLIIKLYLFYYLKKYNGLIFNNMLYDFYNNNHYDCKYENLKFIIKYSLKLNYKIYLLDSNYNKISEITTKNYKSIINQVCELYNSFNKKVEEKYNDLDIYQQIGIFKE